MASAAISQPPVADFPSSFDAGHPNSRRNKLQLHLDTTDLPSPPLDIYATSPLNALLDTVSQQLRDVQAVQAAETAFGQNATAADEQQLEQQQQQQLHKRDRNPLSVYGQYGLFPTSLGEIGSSSGGVEGMEPASGSCGSAAFSPSLGVAISPGHRNVSNGDEPIYAKPDVKRSASKFRTAISARFKRAASGKKDVSSPIMAQNNGVSALEDSMSLTKTRERKPGNTVSETGSSSSDAVQTRSSAELVNPLRSARQYTTPSDVGSTKSAKPASVCTPGASVCASPESSVSPRLSAPKSNTKRAQADLQSSPAEEHESATAAQAWRMLPTGTNASVATVRGSSDEEVLARGSPDVPAIDSPTATPTLTFASHERSRTAPDHSPRPGFESRSISSRRKRAPPMLNLHSHRTMDPSALCALAARENPEESADQTRQPRDENEHELGDGIYDASLAYRGSAEDSDLGVAHASRSGRDHSSWTNSGSWSSGSASGSMSSAGLPTPDGDAAVGIDALLAAAWLARAESAGGRASWGTNGAEKDGKQLENDQDGSRTRVQQQRATQDRRGPVFPGSHTRTSSHSSTNTNTNIRPRAAPHRSDHSAATAAAAGEADRLRAPAFVDADLADALSQWDQATLVKPLPSPLHAVFAANNNKGLPGAGVSIGAGGNSPRMQMLVRDGSQRSLGTVASATMKSPQAAWFVGRSRADGW